MNVNILKNPKKANNERGIALFMVLFALALLSAIALGFMYLANTETAVNANYRSGQQAYFAARAGLQEGRLRIMKGKPPGVPDGDLYATAQGLTMPDKATTAGGIYILNPAQGEAAAVPWDPTNAFFDDSICKGNFQGLTLGYGAQSIRCSTKPSDGQAPTAAWYKTFPSTALNANTASTMNYKWVRITLKGNYSGSPLTPNAAPLDYPYQVDQAAPAADNRPVCWDGLKQKLLPAGYVTCSDKKDMNPVFLITAMSRMPSGSERTLSIEVADDPPFYNNSAVNSQDHVTLNGALTVDGYDGCSCKCSWADPSKRTDPTTYTCTDQPGHTCLRDKYAIYSNSTVDKLSGAQETATAGANPIIADQQKDKTDIDGLINRYKSQSGAVNATQAPYNYSCPPPAVITTPPTNPVCGTHAGQTFGTPPDFPSDGSAPPDPLPSDTPYRPQITDVPGNLQITGGSVGGGILIVEGDLDIHGGLQFYGLIIVKGIIKFSGGGSDKTNIFGSVLAGVSSVDDTVLGGSAAIKYDQCALQGNTSPAPPRLISSREIEY
jgi:Tfp pilus assembly protein PilX